MKLGLLSDTHGHQEGVERAVDRFAAQNVDTVLHAGDITRAQHIFSLAASVEVLHLVRGNCDVRFDVNELGPHHSGVVIHGTEGIVDLADRRIGLTHGHLDSSFRNLRSAEVDLIVHGHTHRRRDETERGIRHLNPGAVKPPDSSAAVLDLNSEKLSFFNL